MCIKAQATTRVAKTRRMAATGPDMTVSARLGGPGQAGAAPDPPVASGNSLHDMPITRPLHAENFATSEASCGAHAGCGDDGCGNDGTGGDVHGVGGQAAAGCALRNAHRGTCGHEGVLHTV